jgi:hypothetical protein
MVLWAVFMAAYYGDAASEFGDRMDPEVVAPDRAGDGSRPPTTSASSSCAPTSGGRLRADPDVHDALLCPTMAGAVAGRQGRPRYRARRRRRGLPAADMTGVFNMVSPCPAMSVPCGAHTAPATPACRSGCRSSAAGGARTRAARRRAVELTSAP